MIIFKSTFFLFGFIAVGYLILPNPNFPKPPPDALQSKEPADSETSFRRAYFTNYTRDQVLDWYKIQMDKSSFFDLSLPTYLLNYPPENAQSIIRDQTRSTFLEEIVHPFRESLYINGFKPSVPKDAIYIDGRNWEQKITVRYVPSSLGVRLVVFFLTLGMITILGRAFKKTSIKI